MIHTTAQRFFAAALATAWIISAPSRSDADELAWLELNAQLVSFYQQGCHTEALPLAQEALRMAERSFHPDDPHIATAANNLAAFYMSLERYGEAEALFERALAIDKAILAEDHPHLVVRYKNLEALTRLKGRATVNLPTPALLPPTAGDHLDTTSAYTFGSESPLAQGTEPLEWNRWGKEGPILPPTSGYSDWKESEITDTSWWSRVHWDVSLLGGYREDDFNWNIAGNIDGSSPNVLSELTWEDLQGYQVEGDLWLVVDSILAVRGSMDYAWIINGDNRDSDYSGDNRTSEYSRSDNASDDGHLVDISLGLGYPFKPKSGDHEFSIIPMLGYSFHEQRVTMTNGFQTIPRTGYFDNLNSEYLARWIGPWAGVSFEFKAGEKWRCFGLFEYHLANYQGIGNWNLRTDLSRPKSFRDTTNAEGIVGGGGISYSILEDLLLHFSANYQLWWTETGIARTFGVAARAADVRFNEANWESLAASLGLRYRF